MKNREFTFKATVYLPAPSSYLKSELFVTIICFYITFRQTSLSFKLKITTKHVSNSPSTFITHEYFAVLLRKLTKVSNKLAFARKNSSLWTVFRKPAFLVPECLKRRTRTFSFQNYPGTCRRTLNKTSSFSLFFFLLFLRMT